MDNSFPKESRLLTKKDFANLKNGAIFFRSDLFLFFYKKQNFLSPHADTRIGISVSSKTTNAVGRNKVKRCVREFFRTSEYKSLSTDMVIVLNKHRYKAKHGYEDYRKDLEYAFKNIFRS